MKVNEYVENHLILSPIPSFPPPIPTPAPPPPSAPLPPVGADYEDYTGDYNGEEDRCSVLVALMQEHRRSKKYFGVKMMQIGFVIYKVSWLGVCVCVFQDKHDKMER